MVHSYKGGVGKSWISLNIAKSLDRLGKRVLLIEADFSMPTYVRLFPELKIDLFFNDYLENDQIVLQHCIYPTISSNMGYIACNPEYSPSERIFTNDQSWFYDLFERLVSDLEGLEYDYFVFDMSPGHSLFLVNILQLANIIFIASRSDTTSIYGTESMLESIYNKFGIINAIETHLVFNQIPKINKFKAITDTWKNKFSVKFPKLSSYLILNLDEEIIYRSALNDYEIPDDTSVASDFERLVDKILQH